MTPLPTLIITLGDPSGIGPEILLKSLPQLTHRAKIVIIGSRAGVELFSKSENNVYKWLWGDPPFSIANSMESFGFYLIDSNSDKMHSAVWFDPYPLSLNKLKLGLPSANSGKSSMEALVLATRLMSSHKADALVTLPISKTSIIATGESFTGHTGYLMEATNSKYTQMIFMSPKMKVALHTVHMSLKRVIESMDAESISQSIEFSVGSFIELMGTSNFRIGVAALNPHAGENGAFGNEDSLIEEAVRGSIAKFKKNNYSLDVEKFGSSIYSKYKPHHPWNPYPHQEMVKREDGLRIEGPLAADSVFKRSYDGEFDLVVAMYHDQGLIPIKFAEPTLAVNVTFGLPFVRTSPDHGTGFDIAGLGIADHRNFQEASRLALRLSMRSKGLFE